MLSFLRIAAAEHADAPEEVGAESRPSFDDVYEAHFDFVWRGARRLGVRPHEIDDVVQEVFLIVHKILPRYEARDAMRAWLFAILVRVVLRHHRAMRRLLTSPPQSELIDALPDAKERGPEQFAEAGERVRLLEELLARLDPEKRAVLVLAGLEQRSNPEIAEILQINLNTVGSRLRAAREEIQAGIARHEARARWRMK